MDQRLHFPAIFAARYDHVTKCGPVRLEKKWCCLENQGMVHYCPACPPANLEIMTVGIAAHNPEMEVVRWKWQSSGISLGCLPLTPYIREKYNYFSHHIFRSLLQTFSLYSNSCCPMVKVDFKRIISIREFPTPSSVFISLSFSLCLPHPHPARC